MKNSKILLEEKQQFKLVYIVSILSICLFITLFYFKIGKEEKQLTLNMFILFSSLFVFIFLLFYKLKVILTTTQLKISFGIIKKSFLIDELNLKEIEKLNIPFYFGQGIRVLKDGMLYNAKSGNGIKIKLKNKNKYLYLVLNDSEKFINKINDL